MIAIQKIELPVSGIDDLLAEASSEGYDFIETLLADWASGENRFDAPGEILYGLMDQGRIVAVGGLNIDPFAGKQDIGRIRRVYVRRDWRGRGIGRLLVATLIEHARTGFRCVRLRADNPRTSAFYESMGFAAIDDPNASHLLCFEP